MKTQLQMWRDAERRSAALNEAFLEIAFHPTNPMTREDLQALLDRRPEQYGKFAGYLKSLPSAAACAQTAAPAPCPAFAHG